MIFNRKLSMRKKLILMFFGTIIIAHLVVSTVAVHIVEKYFFDQSLNLINNTFESMEHNKLLDHYDTKANDTFGDVGYEVWKIQNNKVTYQSSLMPLPLSPNKFTLKNKDDLYSFQWKNGDDTYILSSCFNDPNNTTVIGLKINHHVEFFDTVNSWILWLTFAVSVFAVGLSIIIVNNGLLPLKKFEGYLAQVRPGNLDVRIPTDQLPVELEELGVVQNSMLNRLDEGFKRLSDFSSDISHELRTPLTNMTTQTQVVLTSEREVAEYQDVLGSNLEELDRINKMISDTLYLAQADNSLLYQSNQELNLKDEISQLVDFHNIVAEDKGLTITHEGEGCLFFDKLMFQRAINNLMSNAIRHAFPDTIISIVIKQSQETLTIAVNNIGDTISGPCLPFVFDRFYRSDKSREYDQGFGAGLGLAITKAIIEACGGTITAESMNDKTTFLIDIPNHACDKHSYVLQT